MGDELANLRERVAAAEALLDEWVNTGISLYDFARKVEAHRDKYPEQVEP